MLLIEKIVAYDDMLKECKRRKVEHEKDIKRLEKTPSVFPSLVDHHRKRVCINTAISFRIIKRLRTLLNEYESKLTI